jgi:glycosyltransferase involved in cell wall biosynthesis
VIAADAPGIRESVLNGETGFLVPGGDAAAYAAAMRGIVDAPSLVEMLGENARRFAETFTWDRTARETLNHLELIAGIPAEGGAPEWKS